MTFSTHEQKCSSEKSLLLFHCWGYTAEYMCDMYVLLRRCDFVVKVIKNGCRELKNFLSGNNGCHMSQENAFYLGRISPMIYRLA